MLRSLGEIDDAAVAGAFAAMERRARKALGEQGADPGGIQFKREYDARYRGQSFELAVEHDRDAATVERAFAQAHRTRYGYDVPGEEIEIVNARLTAYGTVAGDGRRRRRRPTAPGQTSDVAERAVWIGENFERVAVLARAALTPSVRRAGPLVVEEYDSTTYVAPGWTVTRARRPAAARGDAAMIDPIDAEIIEHALIYAGEEMGLAVRNSAYSPNIKERLDHSCALFDRSRTADRTSGAHSRSPRLASVGTSPHAARDRARARRQCARAKCGLPTIRTSPERTATTSRCCVRSFIAARSPATRRTRRITPTSADRSRVRCRPTRADIFAEGIVVPPLRLVARRPRRRRNRGASSAANSRTPHERSGDLRAQVAGNYTGERRLWKSAIVTARQIFAAAVERALDNSERRMRAALRALGDGVFEACDALEDRDGQPNLVIALRLELRDGHARLDYSGTSAQVDFPLNAVFGVTLSGRVLRAARGDRSGDPDERRLLPAGRGARAGRNAAQSAASGARLRRQCRDQHAQRRRRAASPGESRAAARARQAAAAA